MTSGAHEVRRFTAEEYLRMCVAGAFADDRVELIDGEILTMSPQGPEHSSRKNEHRERFQQAYRTLDAHLRDGDPLHCDDRSVPEPDLAVVRGAPRDYRAHHPRGTDAILVVEECKSSHSWDRRKVAVYARGGVPVYWLLDLEQATLHVFTDPDPAAGRYRHIEELTEGEVAVPETLDTWDVASFFD